MPTHSKFLVHLNLSSQDIRLLVFPDEQTRLLGMQDPEIAKFFDGDWPIMTTVEDCQNF